jgi:hypothetical protein
MRPGQLPKISTDLVGKKESLGNTDVYIIWKPRVPQQPKELLEAVHLTYKNTFTVPTHTVRAVSISKDRAKVEGQ